jgi:ribonuclease R
MKLIHFISIARPLGYTIHGSLDHVTPHELARVVDESIGRPEHTVIATLLLRCMQKARYDAQCLGHFGLADEFYTHFTSPIRRYPDLLVHRLIRTFLFDKKMDRIKHFDELIPYLAEQSSMRERVAVDTEYDVDDMKKAEYMEEHIGETFEGVISSVTSFGFFVELPNTIEGLVHMNNMTNDYYNFIEDQMMLVGERTAKQYSLGDKVKVTVLDVDKMEKRVDFSVISTTKIKRKKLTPQEDHRSHFHKKKRYGNEKKYGHNSRERKNKKYNKKRRR